jgi:hypothetical protein
MILLKEFKQLYINPLFLDKVSSYNSIFAFTSMGASLMENVQIGEQLAKTREDVYMFRVEGIINDLVSTLLPIECNEVAAIFLDDSMGAERDIILHQKGGRLQ